MKCLSILRYLTDHVDSSVLGVSTRMVITHDVPVMLAQILQQRPWESGNKLFQGTVDYLVSFMRNEKTAKFSILLIQFEP